MVKVVGAPRKMWVGEAVQEVQKRGALVFCTMLEAHERDVKGGGC